MKDFVLILSLDRMSNLILSWASLVAQLVKNPPAMQETWVRSLGWEDPLEKGKATGLEFSKLILNIISKAKYYFRKFQWQTLASKKVETSFLLLPTNLIKFLLYQKDRTSSSWQHRCLGFGCMS